jgi:hypothetical protein
VATLGAASRTELSSPGWARPGLRGGGGAGLGGSGCGSTGVSEAAASAGMRLGPSSLKCGASHSLTPASLRRRAAAAGALPFLVSHSLTRPPFSLLLLCARPGPPPFLAGRTHHPTTAAPRVLLPPCSRSGDLRTSGLPNPQRSPVPRSGCLEIGAALMAALGWV